MISAIAGCLEDAELGKAFQLRNDDENMLKMLSRP
jgi:hypothetical protein